MVSGFLTYGKDTVKRRLMMQSARELESKDYLNARQAYKKIYYQEGVKGFYAGATANIIRGLSGSLCLVLFDEFNHYAKYSHGRSECPN